MYCSSLLQGELYAYREDHYFIRAETLTEREFSIVRSWIGNEDEGVVFPHYRDRFPWNISLARRTLEGIQLFRNELIPEMSRAIGRDFEVAHIRYVAHMEWLMAGTVRVDNERLLLSFAKKSEQEKAQISNAADIQFFINLRNFNDKYEQLRYECKLED